MKKPWFIIINPTSGNGVSKKRWPKILKGLKSLNMTFEYQFSNYTKHEEKLIKQAIDKGFTKFICIGGDGTLHHMINGIMRQNTIATDRLMVAIIPMGTGNDWVKTYGISKDIKKALFTINQEQTVLQDIGRLELINSKENIYFNNLAGIGFDGFVIKNSLKFKQFGPLSYILAAVASFINYKKSVLTIYLNDLKISTKSLLTLVGICRYSGGGMQLTKDVKPNDGLFDISIAKNFSLTVMLINILKFFNGKITNHKEVDTYKTKQIKIISNDSNTFIQADGELIGQGGFSAQIIPNAIRFIIP